MVKRIQFILSSKNQNEKGYFVEYSPLKSKNRVMKMSNPILLACLLIGVVLYLFLKTNEEAVIKSRLADLASVASISKTEPPLTLISKAKTISEFFTPSVKLHFSEDEVNFALQGINNLRQSTVMARSRLSNMNVEFFETKILVSKDQAEVYTKIRARGSIPSQENFSEVRSFQLKLIKIDGIWKINSATNILEEAY